MQWRLGISGVLSYFAFFLFTPHFFQPPPSSVQEIRGQGRLRVIMSNSANVYYSYRGEYMGFEHDLVQAFADHLGVEAAILTPDWDTMFQLLAAGEAHLIAAGLTVTPDRRTLFCNTQHPGNGNPASTNFPADVDGVTIPRDCTLVVRRKDGGIVGS